MYIFFKVSDSIKFCANCFALTLHSSTFVASKCEVSGVFGVYYFERSVKKMSQQAVKMPIELKQFDSFRMIGSKYFGACG